MATSVDSTSPVGTGELSPVLAAKYALQWQHAVLCLVFAILFLYLSYLPLPQSGVWHDAAMGKWIVANRSLPTTDPLLPLAQGMPAVTLSWLSQVLFFEIEQFAGAEALANLSACTVFLTLLILARVFFLQTGHKRYSLLGVLLIVALSLGQLETICPQVFGTLCLSILLWIMSAIWRQRASETRLGAKLGVPKWFWIAVPALTIAWCNLDGSFVVGLVVLVSLAAGQVVDVAINERSLSRGLCDTLFQQLTWLAELALVVTLIQPHGLSLWSHGLQWANNPFWQSVGGYQPVMLASWAGVRFAVLTIGFMLLLRIGRRRIGAGNCFVLLIATAGFLCNENLMIWLAPLAVFVMMPHIAELNRQPSTHGRFDAHSARKNRPTDQPLRFTFTLVCLLIAWCAFALSPISSPVLGGVSRKKEHVYSSGIPWGVSNYLREKNPDSLIWSPAEWGDWLAWNGFKTFANSRAFRLPTQTRFDYAQVFRGEGDWERTLDRYDVEILVIDKKRQERLFDSALRAGEKWSIAYEDEQALILKRRES